MALGSNSEVKAKRFRDTVERVVRMLSSQNVKVTQIGSKADVARAADGTIQSINIPMLPDNASDDVYAATRGFIDAKVAEAMYSDARQTPKMIAHSQFDWDKPLPPLTSVFNVIEEIRLEEEMCGRYDGSRLNFDWVLKYVCNAGLVRVVKEAVENGDVNAAFSMSLGLYLKSLIGNHEANDFLNSMGSRVILQSALGEFPDLPNRIKSLGSTSDSTKLAVDIMNFLSDDEPSSDESDGDSGEDGGGGGSGKTGEGDSSKDKKEDKKPEASEGESEDAEKDKSGDIEPEDGDRSTEHSEAGDGDEEGPDKGAHEEGEAGEDELPEGCDDDGERGKTETPEGQAKIAPEEIDAASIGDTVSDILTSSVVGERRAYSPFTTEYDELQIVKPSSENAATLRDGVKKFVMPIQAKIRRMLASSSFSANYGGYRSGRIKASSLHKVAVGDDRVFSKRVEHEGMETAITLLIDCSGSMQGVNIKVAKKVAFVMSEVLAGLNIRFEVLGFTSYFPHCQPDNANLDYAWAHEKNKSLFTRKIPLITYVFKGFNDAYNNEARLRIDNISRVSLQDNVDGESLGIAVKRIKAVEEKRKIIIVLSDGSPSSNDPLARGHILSSHLVKVVEGAERDGIEIIAFGIQTASVAKYYKNNIIVNNLDELSGRVMSEMQGMLLSGAAKHR